MCCLVVFRFRSVPDSFQVCSSRGSFSESEHLTLTDAPPITDHDDASARKHEESITIEITRPKNKRKRGIISTTRLQVTIAQSITTATTNRSQSQSQPQPHSQSLSFPSRSPSFLLEQEGL